jgi:hypothetical protein
MTRAIVPVLLLMSLAISCAGASGVSSGALDQIPADIRLEVFGMD